jgi:hypothetical protein
MKKTVITAVLAAAFAALLLTGCVGPEGNVFTAFEWVYTPSYLSIEDPAIPLAVYPGTYYMTTPGSYYLEYGHPSYYPPYVRYITYTVRAYPGTADMRRGDDALFTVWLYESTNPVIVEDSARTAAGSASGTASPEPAPAVQSAAPARDAAGRIRQYSYTQSKGGYEISVEGGIVKVQ